MKSVRHRILSALLGVLCAAAPLSAAALPVSAAALTPAQSFSTGTLVRTPANRLSPAQKASFKELPASFDLRNVDGMNFISPVKNQQLWGTCWAFGGLAAAEASAQYELWKKLGLSPADAPLDFSELQLAWFAYTALQEDDPDYASQAGEGLYSYDDDQMLNNGGMRELVISLLAAGIGPYADENVPYMNKSGNVIWSLKDENGNYVLDEDGNLILTLQPIDWDAPEGYSPEGYNVFDEDWSVAAQNRFRSDLRLEHAYQLPCPAVHDQNTGDYLGFDADALNAIKNELINGRAVEISFCADSASFNDLDNPPVYLSENYAHYTYTPELSNHSVCIVGYDDNYSVANFNQTDASGNNIAPPADGAFIVKNSWGNSESEIPSTWGIDNTGYFYISYYDMSLTDPTSYDFTIEDYALTDSDLADRYRRIDQYDLLPAQNGYAVYSLGPEADVAIANVFHASMNEYVNSVGTFVFLPDSTVEYQIYRLNENYANPADGTCVESGTYHFTYSGFHTIPTLNAPVINAGESYSIIVRQTDADGNGYFGAASGLSKELADAYVAAGYPLKAYASARVNEGESFFYTTGDDWLDETAVLPLFTTYEEEDFVMENAFAIDNVPVKGYVTAVKTKFDAKLTFDADYAEEGKSVGYTVTITNNTDFNLTDLTADINGTAALALPSTALAPGESTSVSGEIVPTAQDAAAGKLRLNLTVAAGRNAAWRSVTGSYDLLFKKDFSYQGLGDINRDAVIDLQDVILALQLYNNAMLGIAEPTEPEIAAGDVNRDNTYDLLDVVCILQYYNFNNVLGVDVTWEEIVYNKV